MKIAMVMTPGDSVVMAHWMATADLASAEMERWIIDSKPEVAEQLLDALVAQWQQTPVDMLIFPPGMAGDELATRLAWRLQGESVCQALSVNIPEGWVTKSHWGNALIATLEITARPFCLSLSRQPGVNMAADISVELTVRRIVPAALPSWLMGIESVERSEVHPLLEAKQTLVVGQGGEDVDADKITALAQSLGMEAGYSRARVMNGGYDANRLVGISGQLLAAEVCIVAGASGAAALMAGVKDCQFIVAINHDASAPVFSQADVGIVDDWQPVLDALANCVEA
ncbi:electron transfer flavoprotein subunit alpha/FixB family protein [Klebsiella michiganensis]|uniref:electron transfer flavoprotein subunit alpha/FixB family protein n=1 Tax=Klebsiella michiganensis TaxID=1134687 RepID=UPI000A3D5599|nr:electron transfer flavoprotein subunit alpha/FixB family protein [Klebsiella michiganensis]MCW9337203.1 electron transfer flavoprotein subunit alpha/FixB family protein [Klebsiella michiganensis]OUG42814.1 hypothetical protein AZ037_004011 [Klebsiella michiganensis]